MGLCKCPKRKVTNQFCFEHQVNVCEYCMIDGQHRTCIVGPYLNWLDNSSYENLCNLCRTDLNTNQCVRFCCYHIVHLECLDRYAQQFPPNTAPAGYTCPICSKPIFSFTSRTPITQQLEQLLATFEWAKEGISLLNSGENLQSSSAMNGQASFSSLLDDSTKITMPSSSVTTIENRQENLPPRILHNSLYNPNKMNNYQMATQPINVSNVTSFISTNSDLSFGSTSSMRSKFDNESRRPLLSNVNEIAEDKYRTKSPVEFFSRWLRSRSTYIKNQRTMSSLNIYKKFIIYGFILLLFLFIVIHYFIKYGRQSADNDPFLNPEFDPNIRNHDD
ncbi:Zinc finger protein-like 1 [Dermatophagoides pteronyssinus]|uniref:Zinc finger protein-like 1 homolog n=1 Tax=Dermatophagoides pteronyssinus TaxID=6956 RepID=A0ABQ8IRR7_DERPT|nr:Zinc finger protein-like 1 [Dermatophagoides pteronyssinus]